MISEISLTNFKCFKERIKFDFSKINLLFGINSRGKSTVLQSILLLSQTFKAKKNPQQLLINGEWVELGTFDDIINRNSDNKTITIQIKTDDENDNDIKFEYGEYQKNERFANLNSLKINDLDKFVEISSKSIESDREKAESIPKKTLSPLDDIKTLSLFNKFHYISADRLGPVEYVKKRDTPEAAQIGIRGENLINVLTYHDDVKINNKLCFGKDGLTLKQQTTEWLSYIFDGANIKISGKEKESSILTMMLGSKSGDHCFKSINVGFGYSYILPIIVTGLISNIGDVVVIENPEAHLHPRAQSRLTEFFTLLASCGVQVFIESHSEHILNGLRVNVLSPLININYNELAIHYFSESFESEKLIMDDKGKIMNWPDGFFDQQELDLAEIFKYSRKQ